MLSRSVSQNFNSIQRLYMALLYLTIYLSRVTLQALIDHINIEQNEEPAP
jgi:hypothetical protein